MKFLETKSVYYNNVNLIGQPQNKIKSRSEIPKELNRIIVAPMQAVVGELFTFEALKLGLQVCLPRFGNPVEQNNLFYQCLENFGSQNVWYSIGLKDGGRLVLALKHLKKYDSINILIDVANGYLASVVDLAKSLNKNFPQVNLMVGNVHSYQGCYLYNSIPDIMIRCGIGNGSVCETGKVSGINRGQITEIQECDEKRRCETPLSYRIIADGGIRCGGDIAKAFGAGSDYVMLGGMFAKSMEAENRRNGSCKYFGGSSHYQQILQHGKKIRHSEGAVIEIEKHEPLKDIVGDIWGGISSAVSYSGFGSLTDFIGNGVFEIKK